MFEYDDTYENNVKLGLLNLDMRDDISLTTIDTLNSAFKFETKYLKYYNDAFYYHGNLYFLAWNKDSQLCLCTTNPDGQIIRLICNLPMYEGGNGKCSFVANPHLYGVILANLKVGDKKIRTYISLNNGKHFMPLEFIENNPDCGDYSCGVELDLICSSDSIHIHFPENGIVRFQGTYFKKDFSHRYNFISFNGGKNFKMIDTSIEKLVVWNRGGFIFGTERGNGKIWYSHDEAYSWYRIKIAATKFMELIPLEHSKNLVVVTINYDETKKTYSLLIFDFSKIFKKSCKTYDYEDWYLPRFHMNCFQGQEVVYMKKKPSSICYDDRRSFLPITEPCPCFISDFHCKPNYYLKENFCILERLSNVNESFKRCPIGTKPLIKWNGFTQLDSDVCAPRKNNIYGNFEDYDYCFQIIILNEYNFSNC
ncbi:VPS10 domain-containing receptor SorCS3 [Thelohanellus kitauei]|uniref:VPS10 domain-containing receptor SorCS3 n=1 Tax=Thelohanellus kitauei TaxID=669202 RepID=A0A0C2J651_THEKT|nr:VPS10 domain-containing receptor SorCS3 [Thelohanellus kitauei]